MGGQAVALPQAQVPRPNLTLLTDLGRKYPGFPTPLSPTLSAKELYPTPTSDTGSRAPASRLQSPGMRSASPMSINGSNMGGPSTSCLSHGYEQFPDQIGLIDSVIARSSSRAQLQSPRALSTSPIIQTGPASPDRALSPRAGMLRHMATQQAFRSMHTAPVPFGSAPKCSFNTAHLRRDSVHSHCSPPPTLCSQSVRALSPGLVPKQAARPIVPCIQIANGTEVETGSPISPTGTMLSYTSNRAVDSGLLAIPALSEPQVAEYRFWVPCGRRVCAFGCGGAHEGENAAAKRLFREEDSIVEQSVVRDEGYGYGNEEDSFEEAYVAAIRGEEQYDRETAALEKGRRAEEWKRFLSWRDRDVSVARV